MAPEPANDKLTSPALHKWSLRPQLKLALWLINVGLALALFVFLRPVLVWLLNVASPFFVALIIAYIFNPLVGVIERRLRVNRSLAVVLTFALILGLVVGSFLLLVPALVAQFRAGVNNILERIPILIAAVSEQLQIQVSPEDIERVRAALEGKMSLDNLANQLTPTLRTVVTQLAHLISSATRAIAVAVAYSFGLIAFLILVLMITFYCLIDFSRIGRFFAVLVPPAYRERFFGIWEKIDTALGGFLRGQLVVSVIIGTLYSLALVALGMKQYSLLIGFAAGFGNLIPYVGPVVGAVPTVLWVVFGGSYDTVAAKIMGVLIVLLISVAIQTLDGFVLQPRIVGKSAGLHPLMVIAALVVGAQLGLGGLILAVPVAIVLRVLVRELWWKPLAQRRAAQLSHTSSHPPAAT
ncbi:MAG: AI-2E family transporter [Candidatus Sumerlaeaceae bacterium]|nr:AI-2E family transporter [Candidatus Sumerlaeaceae bacterium]